MDKWSNRDAFSVIVQPDRVFVFKSVEHLCSFNNAFNYCQCFPATTRSCLFVPMYSHNGIRFNSHNRKKFSLLFWATKKFPFLFCTVEGCEWMNYARMYSNSIKLIILKIGSTHTRTRIPFCWPQSSWAEGKRKLFTWSIQSIDYSNLGCSGRRSSPTTLVVCSAMAQLNIPLNAQTDRLFRTRACIRASRANMHLFALTPQGCGQCTVGSEWVRWLICEKVWLFIIIGSSCGQRECAHDWIRVATSMITSWPGQASHGLSDWFD